MGSSHITCRPHGEMHPSPGVRLSQGVGFRRGDSPLHISCPGSVCAPECVKDRNCCWNSARRWSVSRQPMKNECSAWTSGDTVYMVSRYIYSRGNNTWSYPVDANKHVSKIHHRLDQIRNRPHALCVARVHRCSSPWRLWHRFTSWPKSALYICRYLTPGISHTHALYINQIRTDTDTFTECITQAYPKHTPC